MRQEFNVKAWRNAYDQVNILGQYLKDSRPDWEGNPPKFTISMDERKKVEQEIADLIKLSDNYLDKCNLRPREPKWYYDRNNETTWASSEKFLFHNLMRRRKYVTLSI
tara:strand:- start:386 stop:709 length:324 start_codon:yes stop_codon:yes gene_type:complete